MFLVVLWPVWSFVAVDEKERKHGHDPEKDLDSQRFLEYMKRFVLYILKHAFNILRLANNRWRRHHISRSSVRLVRLSFLRPFRVTRSFYGGGNSMKLATNIHNESGNC